MERTPTHDENCCICCEQLKDHSEPEKLKLMTTICGHWMHHLCWLEYQRSPGPTGMPGEECPVCRRPLSGNPVSAPPRWVPSAPWSRPPQHSGWIPSPVPTDWVRHYYADGLSSDSVRPYVQWHPAYQPDRIYLSSPSVTGFMGGGNPPEGYYTQTLEGGVACFVRSGSPEDYRRPGAVAPRPRALSVLERRRALLGPSACQPAPATRTSNPSPILGSTDTRQQRPDITLLFERAPPLPPATDAGRIVAFFDTFNTFPGVTAPNTTAAASFSFNSVFQPEQQEPATWTDLSVRPKTRRVHRR
jgi:hypothetical protein